MTRAAALAAIPRTRHRRTLARVAVAAVDAGWPVVPGAWWSAAGGQFVCDVPGCRRSGPHPVLRIGGHDIGPWMSGAARPGGLVVDALTDHGSVVDRWRTHPYSVLVPTGVACDAVEVPAGLGAWLAGELDAKGRLGPVIEAGRRWTLFTRPAQVPGPPIASDVLQHGLGSWVALPPSRQHGGLAASWMRRPQVSGWALPDHQEVTRLLARAYPHGRTGRLRTVRDRGRSLHDAGAPSLTGGDDLVAMMS